MRVMCLLSPDRWNGWLLVLHPASSRFVVHMLLALVEREVWRVLVRYLIAHLSNIFPGMCIQVHSDQAIGDQI